MGKQWKQAGKAEAAAKKGAQFSKMAKEIQIATKLGGADPDANSRLRMAIDAARSASVPKDTIERAIKKGSGELDGGEIHEVMYEGFGPHQVGVLVECQTDNKNRTAPDMRALFKKHGGGMGDMGSVAWMFDRVGLVEGEKEGEFDPEEEAIEANANEVDSGDEEGSWAFYCAPEDVDSTRSALTDRGWKVTKAELSYKPNNYTELNDEQLQEVYDFLGLLDDHDDSHRIHASLK